MPGGGSTVSAIRPIDRSVTAMPERQPRSGIPRIVAFARITGIAVALALVGILLVGLEYYTAPLAGRVRSSWHAWLRPSGVLGQALGLTALGLFLFLWLYPLRKRLGRVPALGSVPRWLDVHVVAGMLVPAVAAVHAGFRFTGLIGLGYASMFVVALSGFVGRYLYAHIPRGKSGLALTLGEVAAERRQLLHDVATASSIPMPEIERRLAPRRPPGPTLNPLAVIARMVGDDVGRRRAIRRLAKELRAGGGAALPASRAREVLSLARREMALAQQAAMLDGIHRVFRWWHAAHKPFALTALLAVLLHVGVAVALGQTWFR